MHYMFNQIYVHGHWCATGWLIVLVGAGDREEMIRLLGKKGKGGASRGACGDGGLQRHISNPFCSLQIHLYGHMVLYHTTFSSNRNMTRPFERNCGIWEMSLWCPCCMILSLLYSDLAVTKEITVWKGIFDKYQKKPGLDWKCFPFLFLLYFKRGNEATDDNI